MLQKEEVDEVKLVGYDEMIELAFNQDGVMKNI